MIAREEQLTSHREREKEQDSSQQSRKECTTKLVWMWTMDLGILLHHAEHTFYLGPIQIQKQNFGFTSTQRLALFLMSKISVITTFMESRF